MFNITIKKGSFFTQAFLIGFEDVYCILFGERQTKHTCISHELVGHPEPNWVSSSLSTAS